VRDKARYDDKKYLLSYPELAASLPTPVLQKVYSAEELAACLCSRALSATCPAMPALTNQTPTVRCARLGKEH
jgi:hypothetical protein